jgi:IS30 family transposase
MPKGHALSEATKDAIWKLRAKGLSDREIVRQVGLPRGSVSNHLARTGGIRPRARRRPERCLSLEEREEISRAIARGHSDYSPEQIAGWLRLAHPDNEAMQVSHETIYRALYVQARGTLKRWPAAAQGRAPRRRLPRARPAGTRADPRRLGRLERRARVPGDLKTLRPDRRADTGAVDRCLEPNPGDRPELAALTAALESATSARRS